MATWLVWFIVSAFLAVAEIFTGSLYLILASAGAAGAALLSLLDAPVWSQILAASFITLVGWALLRKFRPQNKFPLFQSNPDINMDIGAKVRIDTISVDGVITVRYRGTTWGARMVNGLAAQLDKEYEIKQIDGSTLILG